MTGLDSIVSKIAQESAASSRKIIFDAKLEAAAIIEKSEKESEEAASKILLRANEEAAVKRNISKSKADSIIKNRYLAIKNAIINDIISAAYEQLTLLEDEEYFDFLYRVCLQYAQSGECLMYLSKADLLRLPKDFENKINMEIYEKGAVQISKEPKEIENGFVLDYGKYEINCTLKTIFDNSKDSLKEKLCRLIFED